MAINKSISFNTQKRKLVELIPDPHNPRVLTNHDAQELKKSLTKFDLASIPVIDTKNNILAGHQRIRLMTEMKGEDHEIEVRVPSRDLTKEEVSEYRLRDNRNQGQFDFDILANHYDVEFLMGVGFKESELLGFVTDEFEDEFYEYDDNNCEYPIVPKFSEQYSSVVIFSKNELDANWLKNVLRIESKKDYKNEHIGECNVLNVKQFQEFWEMSLEQAKEEGKDEG